MSKRTDMSYHPRSTLLILLLFSASSFSAVTAQTLFTCGGKGVSKSVFLNAYNKNNTAGKPTDKSYREYLELYIRYQLKVREAYDMQLDTLSGQRSDLQNFRSQISDNYLKDDASMEKLVREAFTRSQHDLHLAHIFIALPSNASPADTVRAAQKAWAAYNALKAGKKFEEAALAWSEDPAVRHNGGDVGYITVFTLPYELESLAYSTPVGQYSKPFRSKAGYHIFRVLGERNAIGRIKIAQILISLPPGATAADKAAARLRADSIYTQLQKGANFAALAKIFSGDNLSYQNGGEMPEFGTGKYDSAFEAVAFSLAKDGAISRPLATAYGYHILKRLSRKPLSSQFDEETAAMLKQQIQNDARASVARKSLLNRILRQINFRKASFSETDLGIFTDSIFVNRSLTSLRGLDQATTLFSFPERSFTVKDWLEYALPLMSAGPGKGRTGELFDRYVEKTAMDYYRARLEMFNPDFASQLTEFKEGNLLFEIMQRRVWDKASTDSAGLRKYYEAHKEKYWWESSADAILFTCSTEKTAGELKKGLKPYVWRQWMDSTGVQADSGRFELAQIPLPGEHKPGELVTYNFVPGAFTPFVISKADNSISFAYIMNIYLERSPRDYKDARGLVINDYQTFLEEQWLAELRRKYPVKVDERVFEGLPKM